MPRLDGPDLAHQLVERPAPSLYDEEDTGAVDVELEHRILPESVERGSRLLSCVWAQRPLHFENQPLMRVMAVLKRNDIGPKVPLREGIARVTVQSDLKTLYPNIVASTADRRELAFNRDGSYLTSAT